MGDSIRPFCCTVIFEGQELALGGEPGRGLPGWAVPLIGGVVVAALFGLWLSSSLWFFTTIE